MQLPLLCSSPLPHLSPPLLSTVWCSFLSSLICSSPLRDAASSSLLRDGASSPLICSSPLLYLSSSTAWCSFLSSHLQLSSISPLPHISPPPISLLRCSPLRDAASSHLQLSSPPYLLLRSPLHDAASSPLHLSSHISSIYLLSPISPPPLSTAWSFLSSLICSSPLSTARCSFFYLICNSPLLHLTPLQLSSDLHCMMQLPLLSHLSSPPSHDAASSPLICTSPPFLISPISPPLLSTAWSFLSSLICSSPPPLSTARCSFLSSSDLHCVMQLPLLSHLQLSSPPSHDAASSPLICTSPPFLISPITPPLLSTAWSFLSYLHLSPISLLSHLSPPLLSTMRCSFLSSYLICRSPPYLLSSI